AGRRNFRAQHRSEGPRFPADAGPGRGWNSRCEKLGRAGCRFSLIARPARRAAMHILLTGSSGWLGRFLAPRLRAAGHVVTGLDVAPGADTDVIGTVADRALVDRIFA